MLLLLTPATNRALSLSATTPFLPPPRGPQIERSKERMDASLGPLAHGFAKVGCATAAAPGKGG